MTILERLQKVSADLNWRVSECNNDDIYLLKNGEDGSSDYYHFILTGNTWDEIVADMERKYFGFNVSEHVFWKMHECNIDWSKDPNHTTENALRKKFLRETEAIQSKLEQLMNAINEEDESIPRYEYDATVEVRIVYKTKVRAGNKQEAAEYAKRLAAYGELPETGRSYTTSVSKI